MDIQKKRRSRTISDAATGTHAQSPDPVRNEKSSRSSAPVNITGISRLRQKLDEMDEEEPERTDRIEELKALISDGDYESEERIDQLVDALLSELL